MTDRISTIEQRPRAGEVQQPWHSRTADAVVAALGGDTGTGLGRGEAADRLSRYGPNRITGEKAPSVWAVALQQLRDPMNIMLVAVVVVSIIIGEVSTAIIVGLLILLNVVLGTRQELKARASVDALAKLQVPEAKVVRDGELLVVPAVELVPGDIVRVEAGDAPSAALTMTFAVMGLGTVGNAIVNRRDPASGLLPPILKAAAVGLVTVTLIILATRVDFLQRSLLTQPLTGSQWLACLGLALVLPVVVEAGKWIRRSRAPQRAMDPERAVTPQRARTAPAPAGRRVAV